jgi:glycosyltransferase involved in cell wall biosynthesis
MPIHDPMSSPLPVVSVLTATYNFERFLPRAIESVLAQDYPAELLDIVVVDDGSTDSTPEVVKPYLDRIRYIRKPNGGLLSTVNRGIEEARGDFVCLFSGDDEYQPDKTRKQVDFLLAHPEVGMVYTDLEVVDDNGARLNRSLWEVANITPVRGRPFGSLLVRNVVSGGTMMFRSELKSEFFPIPESAAWEDWYIALKIAAVAEIDFIAEPLYRYRYHGKNMNLGAEGDKMAGLLREELRFRRSLLAELSPGIVSAAELMTGWAAFHNNVNTLTQMTGEPIEALIPVGEEQRGRSTEAAEEAATAEPEQAVFLLVKSLAEDPWNATAQAELARILAPQAPVETVDGARGFSTLAFADELLAAPEMLTAYAGCFTGADDATLVVVGEPGEIEALGSALDSLGLGDEEGPDMLALDRSATQDLAGHVHAVYSRRAQDGALAARPLVDDGRVQVLYSLANDSKDPQALRQEAR